MDGAVLWWEFGRPAWSRAWTAPEAAELDTLYAGVWTDWWWRDAAEGLGTFAPAYPVLMPWYPLPSPNAHWLDAWALGAYHGYWA
jgi:hypothetical protein